ncbi:MAG TPA: sodium:solute symporter family protein [Verrucomicrobiae bacterium]|nr:sodium:solute symporter family protein [Verrucomicrobiae bacterium]
MNPLLYAGLVVLYVVVMLAVGYWCMKRTKSVGDFFLGGRSLGPWMSAFAYGTTYFSAVLFIGYAGSLGWGFGIHTMWIVIGNTFIGTLLAWLVLARRTREMTARLNALTMPEFLRARYDSMPLQVISALVVFVFLVPYSASVYMGLSYLFQKTLGLQYNQALFFLAGLTGVYLVMGGYFAVAISDFIRGIVEFLGVLIMVVLLAGMKGGLGASFTALLDPKYAPALHTPLPPPGPQFQGWVKLWSLVLITSFGPWALPQMVQKFYSIRSQADVKRAMTIATIFALFMSFGAYYSGALTHLFFTNPTTDLAPIMGAAKKPNLDLLMPFFIVTYVPQWLVLIILLMVFSASMSSLSSLVLVSSSAIAIDIYGAYSHRDQKQKQTVRLMRVLCAVFVLLSLSIALKQFDVIVNLMVIAWGALSGAFLAPYVYGLFWRRATKAGAYASLLCGIGIAVGLFLYWGKPFIPVAGAIAMVAPLLVMPIVSLLTPAPDEAHVTKCFPPATAKESTNPKFGSMASVK